MISSKSTQRKGFYNSVIRTSFVRQSILRTGTAITNYFTINVSTRFCSISSRTLDGFILNVSKNNHRHDDNQDFVYSFSTVFSGVYLIHTILKEIYYDNKFLKTMSTSCNSLGWDAFPTTFEQQFRDSFGLVYSGMVFFHIVIVLFIRKILSYRIIIT